MATGDKTHYLCDKCHKDIYLKKEPRYKISVYRETYNHKIKIENWYVCHKCYIAMNSAINDALRHKQSTWIYNGKTKTIRNCEDMMNSIKLSDRESRLVEVLANGYINNWYDIEYYVFGYHSKYTRQALYGVKGSLLDNVDLHIRLIKNHGLKLDDDIFFE